MGAIIINPNIITDDRVPFLDNAFDLGEVSKRIKTIYANQLDAIQLIGTLDANSNAITNLPAPVGINDAARKVDVELAVQGLSVKENCRAGTTGDITLSGLQTIDGVSLLAGDRILVKNQIAGEDNGIYDVAAGAWARSTDADESSELPPNTFVFVAEGTVQQDTQWVLTNDTNPTIGVDPINFTQFGAAVGEGVNSLNGLVDFDQTLVVGTAGTDFGISSAAGVHTFNIPDASSTNRGLITNAAQDIGGLKQFLNGIKLPNDTYIVGRDFGDTADLNIIKVDASDNTILNADTGDIRIQTQSTQAINFYTNGVNRWFMSGGNGHLRTNTDNITDIGNIANGVRTTYTHNVSSPAGALSFQTAGTTRFNIVSGGDLQYIDNKAIVANTSDASDSSNFGIAGGGALSSTRGAYIQLFGNESVSNAALAQIISGEGGNIDLIPEGDTAQRIRFNTNGSMQFNSVNGDIFSDTADAADTKRVRVGGGGDVAPSRGAVIDLYGNEHVGTPGQLWLRSGDTGNIVFNTANDIDVNATGAITFANGGAENFIMPSSGVISLLSQAARPYLSLGNDTPDGADNASAILHAGQTSSHSRGGYISCRGNEVVGGIDGKVQIGAGATSNSSVEFRVNNNLKWDIPNSGSTITEFVSQVGQGYIRTSTADAADTASIGVLGGGAVGSGRGGAVYVYGNEHASQPGVVLLNSGSTGTIKLSSAAPIETNVDIVPIVSSFAVRASTSDGADNFRISLAGGGSVGDTRGAYVSAHGNERVGDDGMLHLVAGNVAGAAIKFATGGSFRWDLTSAGNLEPLAAYNIGSASQHLNTIYVDNIVGSSLISTDTIDGTDTGSWVLAGGGAASTSRGASVGVYGNENVNTGKLLLNAGNVAGGTIQLITGPTTVRWEVTETGNFEAAGAYNIGSVSQRVGTIYADTVDATTIVGGGSSFPLDNNTYATWRNFADTLDIDVLAVDTNDNTILTAASGEEIHLDTTNKVKILPSGTSEFEFLTETGTTTLWIRPDTTGDSNVLLRSTTDLSFFGIGEGAATSNTVIGFYGNSSADPNDRKSIVLRTANNNGNAHIRFAPQHIERWRMEWSGGHFVPQGTSGTVNIGSSSQEVLRTYTQGIEAASEIGLGIGGTDYWIVRNNGLTATQSVNAIQTNTSDGADNARIQIGGGGATTTTRGAVIDIRGNEAGGGGSVNIAAGQVGVGAIRFQSGSASTLTRWTIDSGGTLFPEINNTYDIGTSSLRVGTLYVDTLDALSGAGGGVNANDTYIQWRNAGDTADLDVIKVDTGDEVHINASTGNDILLTFNGNERFRFTNNHTLQFTGGDFEIFGDTSARRAIIAGGGSVGDGAYFAAYGNTHAQTGRAIILSGSGGGGISFRPAGVDSWNIIDGGPITFATSSGVIAANTVNAADTKALGISGGGVEAGFVSEGRGGSLALYGNEHATNAGEVFLTAGAGAGNIKLQTVAAEPIEFFTQFSKKWEMQAVGNDFIFTTGARIRAADGVDNQFGSLHGGDATGTGSGARIQCFGNTHAFTGQIRLEAGNIAGGEITFNTSATDRWIIAEAGDLVAAQTTTLIRANTADAADTASIEINGGGGAGNVRGGSVEVYGNEHGTFGGDVLLQMGAGGEGVKFIGSANNERLRVTQSGELVFPSGGSSVIRKNTADASDNAAIRLEGGGGQGDTRGSSFVVHGNEHASFPGLAFIQAGNVAGGEIQMRTGGAERWKVTDAGHLEPFADSTYDIGSNTDRVRTIYVDTMVGATAITALGTIPNDDPIQWRNAANTADLDVLFVNTSNETVLASGTASNNIQFSINSLGTAWLMANSAFLSPGGLLGNLTNNIIGTNTTDGNDTDRVIMCGGASNDSARGAQIHAHGNENATAPGHARIFIGDVAGAEFSIWNDNPANRQWAVDGASGHLFYDNGIKQILASTTDGSDNQAIYIAGGGTASASRGAYLRLYGNEESGNEGQAWLYAGQGSNAFMQIGTSADYDVIMYQNNIPAWRIGTGGKLLGDQTTNIIGTNTSDTADNERLVLTGGGDVSSIRGSRIELYGNEFASDEGCIYLKTGSDTGNDNRIYFQTGTAGLLSFQWTVDSNGNFVGENPVATGTNNIRTSDNASEISLSGGTTNSIATGAQVRVYGNNNAVSSRPGDLYLDSGNPANAGVYLRSFGTTGKVSFGTGGSGTERWKIEENGNAALQGVPQFNSTALISTNTVDASDNAILQLNGGGAQVSSPWNRGATLRLIGNENGGLGGIELFTGTGVAGHCHIGSIGTGDIRLRTSNTIRWQMVGSTGHLVPFANNTYDIGNSSQQVRDVYMERFTEYQGSTSSNQWSHGCAGASSTLQVSTNSASTRTFGIVNTGAGISRIQVDGVTVGVPFTGLHVYEEAAAQTLTEGDAVKLVNRQLVKCTAADDQACIGIYTSAKVETDPSEDSGQKPREAIHDSFGAQYLRSTGAKSLSMIASVGDSIAHGLTGAKICDEGGAVVDGDLLCTASKAGFLKKQSDDIVRAKTVAQARESVTFDGSGEATGCYVYLMK